ncbi:hypothetical protein J4468_01385 [Candidatus Woesearchaeota archaeon]|nr:hypothetical protein [Candidatus Woesearchaeota archaeon]
MELPSKVRFANEKLKMAFGELEKSKGSEKELYAHLIKAFECLEKDAFCGIQIPKRLIPKEYIKKYGIYNLWKYNLPNAWRLIYSIENQEILIVSIVLEWLSHKEYNKRFNY